MLLYSRNKKYKISLVLIISILHRQISPKIQLNWKKDASNLYDDDDNDYDDDNNDVKGFDTKLLD